MKHPLTPAMLAMHVAVMGKTGSGKTYAAKGAVENLLATGAQVVVLDPTSAWWGLRLKPDGKTPAFSRVVVMGGRRGDIPLSPDPAQAEAVAAVVCDQGLSVVLDTGSMTVGERTRWAGRFGEALYRLADGRPIHLVIDEAHVFAPQGSVPSPDVGVMVHAFNQLASGGRSRGLRLIVITQRPAKLHKDTLTSCDTLAALRVIAPQDREAIEAWIKGCGDKAKATEVLDSLASLKRGEGWVWYPEIDPTPHRVTFPTIGTYDSSATPTGDGRRDVQMGEVDTAALGKLIASAGEKIKADDPKALRARIKELEARPAATPGASKEELLAEFQRGYANGAAVTLKTTLSELQEVRRSTGKQLDAVEKAAISINECLDAVARRCGQLPPGESFAAGLRKATETILIPKSTFTNGVVVRRVDSGNTAASIEGDTLPDRILNAVAFFNHLGQKSPSRDMVAALLGYHPNTKSYANAVGALRSGGELQKDVEGLHLVKARRWSGGAATPAELVLAQLTGRKREIFARLLQSSVTRDALAAGFGCHPKTKSFNNDVSALCGLGVVERHRGELHVAEWIGGAA